MTAPTSTTTPEGFLTAGGAKSATWPDGAYGLEIGGVITQAPDMVPVKDYDSGEPKFYPDSGKAVEQLRVIVQTDERDPATPDDDGKRAMYFKGQARTALIEAMRASNAEHKRNDAVPQAGGQLFMRYVRDEPNEPKNGRPRKPTKVKECRYIPAGAAAVSAYMAAPTGTEAPTATGVPAPAGVDPAKWAAMTEPQKRQMYAALGETWPGGNDAPPF